TASRCYSFLLWRVSRSTLFPYTTLFRSVMILVVTPALSWVKVRTALGSMRADTVGRAPTRTMAASCTPRAASIPCRSAARLVERSEEHTSELQSRENLVCRLLPEKKNND